jgi:glycosyltransferase involved in cell wall biosynthesis
MRPYFEAFSTCVNYSDFLELSFINKKHFDRWVIVTAPGVITKNLCEKLGIECIESHRFFNYGDKFNKGKALNDAINYLSKKDWLISIDVDIMLPEDFRQQITKLNLDNQILYGVKRREIDIVTKKWKDCTPNVPCGYFQMFTMQAAALENRSSIYPEQYENAAQYDMDFIDYWKGNTKMLNIMTNHIFHGKSSINWGGRVSAKLSREIISFYKEVKIKMG